MSQYQGGQYPQSAQQHQQQNYGNDPYHQYGLNGAHPGSHAQQSQSQSQYPGQPQYDQSQASGGPVQQPQSVYQDTSQSPRIASTGAAYPGQPRQYQYNPQHFAPPTLPTPMQQYNPQHYSSPTQQYSSSSVGSPEVVAQSTSGPLDPYAYAPSNYSSGYNSPQTSQQPDYGQSPHRATFSPPPPHYSPRPPSHQPSYQSHQSPALPQHYGGYSPPLARTTSRRQEVTYPTSDYRPHSQSVGSAHPPPPQHAYNGSPSLPGLPDEWRPSPPINPFSDSRQSPSPLYQSTFLPSPPSATAGPTPPAHAPSRSNTLDRHPQSRPLPGPPSTSAEQGVDDYFRNRINSRSRLENDNIEALSQEDLFQQVENAVLNAGRIGPSTQNFAMSVSQAPSENRTTPVFAPSSPNIHRNASNANGNRLNMPPQGQYSDESDAEATQGLAMMQMDEEEDARRRSGSMRFGSGHGSQRSSHHQMHLQSPRLQEHREQSDSDDYGNVDMGAFGGGYDVGHMSYGGDPNQLAVGGEMNSGHDSYSQPVSSQHSSMRRSHASQSSQLSRVSRASQGYDYTVDSIHPFPPFNTAARVDAGGTGGLSEPTGDGRRQSYDEGDEYALTEGQLPDRFPDEPPDIFYRPASTSYRPLPPPPPESDYSHVSPPQLQTDLRSLPSQQTPYPTGPDAFQQGTSQGVQAVPRSTSLLTHTTTPQVVQPLRSKTDAEERRLRQQQLRASAYSTYESTPASATPGVPLDLPSLPGKRFMPSQLGAPAFKRCTEPWSLMSILKWLLTITNPEHITEIKEAEVKEALVALFTNKVPTMNITDAESLSNKVVADMYVAGTLVTTEEWVRIVPGPMQGVIFQLTGSGCYSPTLHDHIVPGRCYSHHCQRTLKKVNLSAQPLRLHENWQEFYKLRKEDVEGKERKEIERQNVLHEIVQTEDGFMEQLNVLQTLYRDTLVIIDPSIITPRRKDKFIQDVFGKVDAIKAANEEHLLPQLKYRQQEQGPWIVGFSDIFRQWIRKAKAAYIDYAGGFPGATFMVRQEIDRNIEFRNFVDRARNDKRSSKLGWDTFLKAPITRLQRYTLLLQTVLKAMRTQSEEKTNLQIAYDEVKAVTLECDARVAEMQRKVDLSDLSLKLVLRPGMQNAVELNLDHFGRELIYRGDLQRMGGNRFTWLDSHALLFDHYLVLAKTVASRAEQGGKLEKYDVSRLPIPMDLLILESSNDPPVQKSSYMKGITSVRDVAGRTSTPSDPSGTLGRTPSNQSGAPGTLQHVNTGSSATSISTVNNAIENKDADRIMYPFKVKHLGRDIYTLFAPTESARRDWVQKIIEAKTKHAMSLHNQNAEPFKLRVMADSAFYYDSTTPSGGRSVVIRGTPVDRAVKEVEQRFKDTGRPVPVCRARVNCATSFAMPSTQSAGANVLGKQMIAVGTDIGVFVSEMNNPRGWSKTIPMARVTQVAVLEEFNLFLLISDKSLIAYHLDVVCPSDQDGPGPRQSNDAGRKAPQKLSGSRDVGFFVTGKMKERTLVFYKKRENLASVFKVLEPIYQKSSEKKTRSMFKRGTTEFFREYDEFYIPAESGGMNLFQTSLAVSTARGFEVLTLDKKQAMSVPELKAPHVQNIATHIKDQKALGMLRLSDQEFLLVYVNCAVYVNKHGDVSRSKIMEFVGNAQSAALYGAYLILFDDDFVEIRNAQNGRLKQIIAGRDVKCLDDGGGCGPTGQQRATNGTATNMNGAVPSGGTVKLVMQHPDLERTQIVVELLLNENMKE